jgi:hypothetical protein
MKKKPLEQRSKLTVRTPEHVRALLERMRLQQSRRPTILSPVTGSQKSIEPGYIELWQLLSS